MGCAGRPVVLFRRALCLLAPSPRSNYSVRRRVNMFNIIHGRKELLSSVDGPTSFTSERFSLDPLSHRCAPTSDISVWDSVFGLSIVVPL